MDTKFITEELNRKAMDALASIVEDHENGIITAAQASTGIRGVFDSVSGLVSQPVFDLISSAASQYAGTRGFEVQMKQTQSGLKGIMRECGTPNIYGFRAVHRADPAYDVTDANADKQAQRRAAQMMERL